jgi:hypothetical protein
VLFFIQQENQLHQMGHTQPMDRSFPTFLLSKVYLKGTLQRLVFSQNISEENVSFLAISSFITHLIDCPVYTPVSYPCFVVISQTAKARCFELHKVFSVTVFFSALVTLCSFVL